MTHSFIAYIDEAGDDGFPGRFREAGKQGGASNWFSIGAVVWRASRDLDFVATAKSIVGQMPIQKRSKPLHFADMDHPQRVMAINTIAGQPYRSVTVFANKPAVPNGTYAQKNTFYHYMSRYLIERISWLCRDYRPEVREGDGRVQIIFARRGNMDYDDFRSYLDILRNASVPDIRIHWPVIDIAGVQAYHQRERYGLQLADIVTSGLNASLEPDFYGNVETRYLKSVKDNVYSRKRNYLSYGAKMVPSCDLLAHDPNVREFQRIFQEE